MNDLNKETKTHTTFVLERTDKPSLKFEGELLGTAEGFEGANELQFFSYSLYKTKAGKLVCHSKHIDCYTSPDDVVFFGCRIADDISDIIDFFGQTCVAHQLYANAGIDNFENID